MAYSFDRILKDDDDNDLAQPGTVTFGGQAAPAAGSAMMPAAQARSVGSTAQNPGGPSAPSGNSSGFINFDRILSANSSGANRVAGELAGDVQAKGQEASTNIRRLKEGFDENNNAAYGDQYKLNPKNSNDPFNTGSGPQQYVGGTLKGTAAQGGDATAYKDLRGNEAAWTNTLSSVDAAQRAAQNIGSESGVQAALQAKHGAQQNYSSGNSRFDAGLAQAAGGGRFDKLNKQYGSLMGSLDKANANAARVASTQSTAYNNWAATQPAPPPPYDYEADSERRSDEAKIKTHNEYFDRIFNDQGVYRPGTGPSQEEQVSKATGMDLTPGGEKTNPNGTPLNDGQLAKQEYDMLVALGFDDNSPRMKQLKARMGWGS